MSGFKKSYRKKSKLITGNWSKLEKKLANDRAGNIIPMALELGDLWFTHRAQQRMREQDISRSDVLRTINSGTIISTVIAGATARTLAIGNRRIGVCYKAKTNRLYSVITCWAHREE